MVLKVWNEDLIRALVARQQRARADNHHDQHMYRLAVVALQSQRKDIKRRSDGLITNLPPFSERIKQLCERIIHGQEEVITPDLVQYDPEHNDDHGHADAVAELVAEDVATFVRDRMKYGDEGHARSVVQLRPGQHHVFCHYLRIYFLVAKSATLE
ncbi:unnamed protein product [Amoebophrya sp. A120]|nr:unnamed protein product [Amoebophrya sp. A120]|eukprot:GSA120T00005161001.1